MVGAGRGPFMGMRGYMETTCVHMYIYIYIQRYISTAYGAYKGRR